MQPLGATRICCLQVAPLCLSENFKPKIHQYFIYLFIYLFSFFRLVFINPIEHKVNIVVVVVVVVVVE